MNKPELAFKERIFYVDKFTVDDSHQKEFFSHIKPKELYLGISIFTAETNTHVCDVLVFNDNKAPFMFNTGINNANNAIKYEIENPISAKFEKELEPEQYLMLADFMKSDKLHKQVTSQIIKQSFCDTAYTFVQVAKKLSEARSFEELPGEPEGLIDDFDDDMENEYDEEFHPTPSEIIDSLNNIKIQNETLFYTIIKLIQESVK